jgi:hypothetical protein
MEGRACMDYKIFKMFNRLAGHNFLFDRLMILTSKKVHYVFVFVLIYKLFQNRSSKKMVLSVIASGLSTLFINKGFRLLYYKPRPFEKEGTEKGRFHLFQCPRSNEQSRCMFLKACYEWGSHSRRATCGAIAT